MCIVGAKCQVPTGIELARNFKICIVQSYKITSNYLLPTEAIRTSILYLVYHFLSSFQIDINATDENRFHKLRRKIELWRKITKNVVFILIMGLSEKTTHHTTQFSENYVIFFTTEISAKTSTIMRSSVGRGYIGHIGKWSIRCIRWLPNGSIKNHNW